MQRKMKVAKLFNNGRSQAVRLPKEFRFKEKEVYITKIDDFVVLIPKKDKWELAKKLLMEIEDFTDEFMENRNIFQQTRELF
ncbi:MAG: Virulence-associated protein VagC [Thermodesulfobacterium sp.]|uniref:Virulence-associated protein VagC n=1 Tax=Candidatus Thermodesulfobacterium syntrophicum TaxID=3060442 RepID=A0AAE3P1F6_9BACT|nr:Virulence-associated protein VagC [Candidatus Thermodesulfobacterium syntrophicum]